MDKKILLIFDVYAEAFKSLMRGFRPSVSIKKAEAITLMEIKKKPLMSMKHYLKAVDMECGSFTYIADKLENRGLIRRVPCAGDKRISLLELTDAGHAAADRIEAEFVAHLKKRAACLDAQELDTLESAAGMLEDIIEKLRQHT